MDSWRDQVLKEFTPRVEHLPVSPCMHVGGTPGVHVASPGPVAPWPG